MKWIGSMAGAIVCGFGTVGAMTLAEAERLLADDSFAVREEAERVLRGVGLGGYERVARLLEDSDPERATRAWRTLPILLLDIDERWPGELVESLRYLDRQTLRAREQALATLAEITPLRLSTLAGLHAFLVKQPLPDHHRGAAGFHLVEELLVRTLREDAAAAAVDALVAARYPEDTIARLANLAARARGEDLAVMVAAYAAWTEAHPGLVERLDGEGYRLEILRLTAGVADPRERLANLLSLGATVAGSRDRMAALRRELGFYREVAGRFPVAGLDQETAWFFFDVYGNEQGIGLIQAYREFRERHPDLPAHQLAGQPLETLRVLEDEGAAAAMDHALALGVHGGIMVLATRLHAEPWLVREPLPLPAIKAGDPYPYRSTKFFRVFAPYPDDGALKRENPAVADAVEVLYGNPEWREVARQARILEGNRGADFRDQRPQEEEDGDGD